MSWSDAFIGSLTIVFVVFFMMSLILVPFVLSVVYEYFFGLAGTMIVTIISFVFLITLSIKFIG